MRGWCERLGEEEDGGEAAGGGEEGGDVVFFLERDILVYVCGGCGLVGGVVGW